MKAVLDLVLDLAKLVKLGVRILDHVLPGVAR